MSRYPQSGGARFTPKGALAEQVSGSTIHLLVNAEPKPVSLTGQLNSLGDSMRLSRRRLIQGASTLACTASFPTLTLAQVANPTAACPPGTRLKSFRMRTEVSTQERSITLFGFGTTQKVPVRVVTTELECEPTQPVPPPPPPPSPPPKSLSDIFDLDDRWLSQEYVLQHRADQFRASIVTSQDIAYVAPSVPRFRIQGVDALGRFVNGSFDMIYVDASFRIAAPHLVDYWVSTTGASMSASRWWVEGMAVVSRGLGVATFGVSYFLGGEPLSAYSGQLVVEQRESRPGFVEIQ